MKTIEQLQAEHAAAIDTAQKQLAIASAAPVTPDNVMLGKLAPWVIYRKRTLAQALDLFRAYTVVPMYMAKNSSTEIAPEGCYHGRNMTIQRGPFALAMTVDKGDGYGPSVKFKFYGMVGDTVAQIGVDIEGPDYIGMFNALAPELSETRDRNGRIIARQFQSNTLARSLFDHVVTWSSGDVGPIKKSASHSYLLQSDDDRTAPGGESSHACGQLQNLIDATEKGARQ